MKLLLGCPIGASREWVLPYWYQHVLDATDGWDVEFAFVMSPEDEAAQLIVKPWKKTIFWVDEERSIDTRKGERDWPQPGGDRTRYEHMVEIRNSLLGIVREKEPDLFLSLDSDILLHPKALNGMVETLDVHKKFGCWAVGGGTYMGPSGTEFPSYGMWTGNRQGLSRKESHGQQLVDVIMAIKLMTPEAYNVDYTFHNWGEDLGWCDNVAKAGGKLWWDGRHISKHCMNLDMIYKIDERCGF